jgi:hypothetical protein
VIIEANGKFYTTTQHTDEKILMEHITESQIKRVIEEGTSALTIDGYDIYRLTIRGKRLALVIADDERIVTVYLIE